MRVAPIVAMLAVLAAGGLERAEARTYLHRHAWCGTHQDFGRSNLLSPLTYVYPAANWGPFFACHLYLGPVYVYQPVVY